ncbi:hypothetical protein [Phytohabitans kaempferiae]|uniref:IrrE N-terminal-like domain-containing protein n=1 Tax=Phytohabitans kaempferiae TaxID=1620943 RepID=A0ABV6M9Y3_9ACTN
MAGRSTLRQRCERLVATLDIPTPLDIELLCQRVGQQLDRRILLCPMAMPTDAPCGVWIATDEHDMILFERLTSPLHQRLIILHELGHLVAQHVPTTVDDRDAARLLVPDLDPDVVARMLGRTHFSAEEERTAELIASLILRRATQWAPTPQWTIPAEAAGVIMRIRHVLGNG